MDVVERDEALTRLHEALRRARAGHGSALAVIGTPATGKTALLSAFVLQARSTGVAVLVATGSRGEAGLTYGVLRQLLDGATAEALPTTVATHLLDDAVALGPLAPTDGDNQPVDVRLTDELRQLARHRPLLVAVDDVDHADPASVRCLLHLLDDLAETPIVVLLATAPPADPATAALVSRTDQPPLGLALLTIDGVAAMLSQHTGAAVPAAVAAEYHRVSGGNPLLVRALIEDSSAVPGLVLPPAVTGDAYAEALLDCLYRGRPSALRVARAVAVVGDDRWRDTLAGLAGVDTETVATTLDLLTASGLLHEGRLRHPAAQDSLLRHLIAEKGPDDHRRAAQLLHREGAPPNSVADQLLAVGAPPDSWAVPVLRRAAHHALAAGRLDHAVRNLELASTAAHDEAEQAAIKSLLCVAEWQRDPASAARHLSDLTAAASAGRLGLRQTVTTLQHLLWSGRVDEAVTVMRQIRVTGDEDARTAGQLARGRSWLAYAYPAIGRRLTVPDNGCGSWPRTPTGSPHPSELLVAALEGRPEGGQVAQVEQLLQERDGPAWQPPDAAVALITLIVQDRADRAAHWTTHLRATGGTRLTPTWQALLAALQAEAARRQGDLRLALTETERALRLLSRDGWGVAIGAPVSTRVLALVATGHLPEAADLLHQPVPPATFQTPFGLHFLHARGRYYAATEQPDAALVDFHTCGELMREWEVDLPSLVPWRGEAARVYLALGREEEAARLAREQLRLAGDRRGRSRGLSLLVVAAASPLAQRLDMLREAADILESAGDRLGLLRALNDEAAAHHAVGNAIQGRMMEQRARQVAAECGIPGSGRRTGGEVVRPEPPVDAEQVAALSDAERRVAVLAAQGFTNREIADQLTVTVSTVEQHLTRVYRKLQVRRRADLPYRLGTAMAEPS